MKLRRITFGLCAASLARLLAHDLYVLPQTLRIK